MGPWGSRAVGAVGVGAAESRAAARSGGAVGRRGRSARSVGPEGRRRPTFEADPIGRRLECLPKKGININFTLFLNVFLMGPRGPQGLIKMPQGPQNKKKIIGGKFEKSDFLVRKCQLFLKFLFFDVYPQN